MRQASYLVATFILFLFYPSLGFSQDTASSPYQ
ncbi:MAG: hypothetical protein JWM28_2751, partial [Chitinophagaceae bacterium]|nr:hypothetical protein [Chitinophagaceae bacterium]